MTSRIAQVTFCSMVSYAELAPFSESFHKVFSPGVQAV